MRSAHQGALAPVGVLALLTACSIALFGRGVVDEGLSDAWVGDPGADKGFYAWCLAWWPHAIADGTNPFHTDALWAPGGTDLAWTTSIPGLALVGLPLTVALGPVAAANLLALAGPPLGGFAVFLLCRRLTGRFSPSLVGALLYAFSPYEAGHMLGHVNLSTIFLPPLAAYLVVRHLQGDLRRSRLIAGTGVIVALQILISLEIFATSVLAGGFLATLTWALGGPGGREGVRRCRGALVAGLGLGLLLASPFLVALMTSSPAGALTNPSFWASDLAAFVLPGPLTWLQFGAEDVAARFTAGPPENGAYVGLPLIIVTLLATLRSPDRADRRLRVLGLAALVVALCSIGPRVRIGGTQEAISPFGVLSVLPVMREAQPIRFMLYVTLALAVLLAIWIARPQTGGRRAVRYLAGAAVLLTLVPNASLDAWRSDVERPAFFAGDADRRVLAADDIVVVLPFGDAGQSQVWQAESGFRWRMGGGYTAQRVPADLRRYGVLDALRGLRPLGQGDVAEFRRYLSDRHVTRVLATDAARERFAPLLAGLDVPPIRIADVTIYDVARQDRAQATPVSPS